MSLYPSLEDMKAGEMVQAQFNAAKNATAAASAGGGGGGGGYPSLGNGQGGYGGGALMQTTNYPRLHDYMGLELTEEMIRLNMPEYLPNQQQLATVGGQGMAAVSNQNNMLIAPISGQSSQITHNIRRVQLYKPSSNSKFGLRVRSMNTGVFVCLVVENSIAAKAGLRFGDQILQMNSQDLIGMDVSKVHSLFKKESNLDLVVRDRPFERNLTLIRDSHGSVGFQFKSGKIINIVKDSSAARNGLLTQHQLLEVNGRNVVGLKDKQITEIIQSTEGAGLKITIMPSFLYDHIVKEMDKSLFGKMEHSNEDV